MLCVIGEDGPHPWYGDARVLGVLTMYLVIEVWPALQNILGHEWDTAALVSLNTPVEIPISLVSSNPVTKASTDTKYPISQFLLVQRYPDFPWDGAPSNDTVFVFGVRIGDKLEPGPLSYPDWKSKTVPLTTHSLLKVAENCSWCTEIDKLCKHQSLTL
jgi:hypothetical protein